MSSGLSHQELRDLLPAAALDILDSEEHQRVQAHLLQCPECMRLINEYREASAALPLLLPNQPLDPARSAALRTRLLARASSMPPTDTGEAKPFPGHAEESPEPSWSERWVPWSGWLVAAGLAGVLMVHHSVHRPIDYGWLVAGLLMFGLIVLAGYAWRQRARASTLRERLSRLEAPDPP